MQVDVRLVEEGPDAALTNVFTGKGLETHAQATDPCGGGTFVAAHEMIAYLQRVLHHINMLRWVIAFLVIAIIAGLLGFTGIAGDSAYIAKILFFLFLVLMALSLLFGKRIWK